MKHNISCVSDNGLCVSCGLCAAVCPAGCIAFSHSKGMDIPAVNDEECTGCGQCLNVCPGKGFDYGKYGEIYDEGFGLKNTGIYTAATRDSNILMNAASGGVATQLISCLLNDGLYDMAFVVKGYSYDNAPELSEVHTPQELAQSQKSRYLTVSCRKCAEYILSRRDARIVLAGTGCFVHGMLNLIETYNLDRNNYFLLGLFCDRTMTMNVIKYFRNHPAASHGMKEFYFRTKDAGGWPGGVRIVGDDGSINDLPNTERMKVKDYFMPERCLYCLDKLNMFADISCGDNYTGRNSDAKGSSSVIVRTGIGREVWEKYSDRFAINTSSSEEIYTSQHLKGRQTNYFYAGIKGKATGQVINHISNYIPEPAKGIGNEYHQKLRRIMLGGSYEENPDAMIQDMQSKKKKHRIIGILRKIYHRLFASVLMRL